MNHFKAVCTPVNTNARGRAIFMLQQDTETKLHNIKAYKDNGIDVETIKSFSSVCMSWSCVICSVYWSYSKQSWYSGPINCFGLIPVNDVVGVTVGLVVFY